MILHIHNHMDTSLFAVANQGKVLITLRIFYVSVITVLFSPQLVVGLLFLTAIAGLALPLAEGRDPDNGIVIFVNPALFAV